MMGRTHLMGGVASLWLLHAVPGLVTLNSTDPFANIAVRTLAAGFGAVLPDLDAQESYLKRLSVKGIAPFVPPANWLHSLAGWGIVSVVVALPIAIWLGIPAGLAVMFGYASHLLLDACTRSGIPLLFPNRRRFHVLPRWLWVTTGSPEEGLVFVLMALLILLLLLPALSSAATTL